MEYRINQRTGDRISVLGFGTSYIAEANERDAVATIRKAYEGYRSLFPAIRKVCMLGSLGMLGQWVFDRFVMASGKSSLFLFTLSAASVTNLILDPIFIFGYFGFPVMGTAGAALATITGQWAGCFAGYFINRRFNKEIPIVAYNYGAKKPERIYGSCRTMGTVISKPHTTFLYSCVADSLLQMSWKVYSFSYEAENAG